MTVFLTIFLFFLGLVNSSPSLSCSDFLSIGASNSKYLGSVQLSNSLIFTLTQIDYGHPYPFYGTIVDTNNNIIVPTFSLGDPSNNPSCDTFDVTPLITVNENDIIICIIYCYNPDYIYQIDIDNVC